ncbi:hypothetical protein AGMMS50268_32970 [Spirochaetia bacterium]|nr:hypothetical protein AGMMS50268_32970 [Spirochaetia bacterium]
MDIKDLYWEIGINAGFLDFSCEWLMERKEQGYDMSHFSFYGSPGLLWDGGREVHDEAEFDRYVSFISFLNEMGIGFNVTAQNLFISSNMLKNERSNTFMEILNKTNLNGVIILKDILKDYVKDKCPNLKTISSINKAYIEQGIHSSASWYKSIFSNFDYCVINGNDMYDFELLNSLEPKKRMIILINEYCARDCIDRSYHIAIKSMRMFKEFDFLSKELMSELRCSGVRCGLLLPKENLEKYFNIGIDHFKIQARESTFETFKKILKKYFD